jgi:hypothetical protein
MKRDGFCITALFLTLSMGFFPSLLPPDTAEAVPAFARKYTMECTACHTRPPRLNSFGERFLENGYQIPGTQDGGIVGKIKLGNVTLDDVSNFLALRYRGNFVRRFDFHKVEEQTAEEAGAGGEESGPEDRTELAFPQIVNIFFAGTLARNLGTFVEIEGNFAEEAVEFERGLLTLNNLLHTFVGPNVAHLRAGKLDPSAFFSYPTHRQLILPVAGKGEEGPGEAFQPPAIERLPLVPNAFAAKFFGLFDAEGRAILPLRPLLYNTTAAIGIDVHGRPFGDWFLYQVGILNGAHEEFGDSNNSKDVYVMGRLDWARSKLLSASLSGFAYFGNATAKVMTDDYIDWHRYGIGANIRWRMIDVYGAFIWDKIKDLPPALNATFNDTAWGVTIEADVLATNSLLLSIRYDQLEPGGMRAMQKSNAFLALQAKYYYRDNIGFFLRGDVNLRGKAEHPFRELRNAMFIGVDLAY